MNQQKSKTFNSIGKAKRMERIFKGNSKCLIVPMDDSLINGPFGGLNDLKQKYEQIIAAQPSAILGFYGLFKIWPQCPIPGILNLTASTTRSLHTKKVLVNTVEKALIMGMDAVAVHVNVSSHFESEMLQILGSVAMECDRYGMPLTAILYPRSEDENTDNNYIELKEKDRFKYADLVAHCVRIGVELGADIIKTQYTGCIESFKKVIASSCNQPVVIAGGKEIHEAEVFKMVQEAMEAGAAGISLGRNVFNRANSELMVKMLKKLLNETRGFQEIYEEYRKELQYGQSDVEK